MADVLKNEELFIKCSSVEPTVFSYIAMYHVIDSTMIAKWAIALSEETSLSLLCSICGVTPKIISDIVFFWYRNQ